MAFILIGLLILFTYDKIEIHLSINSVNSSFLDFFFKYWTYLGDGIVAPVIVLILGLISYQKNGWSTFIWGFSTLITAGFLAQILKRTVFPDALRPIGIIDPEKLHLVNGVDLHTFHSFPSGHTAAGFAFMAFIAGFFFAKNKIAQIIIALAAVLIGYSRMYLSQHFLEDVVTGAVLGILSYVIAFTIKSFIEKKALPKT
ncbi:MAG: phosphatase PAP2 family protein [Crocinitomicaceae bacterium]|nr:phosphatase PAP2 family protein [Crocinitomicaceae bacterium]